MLSVLIPTTGRRPELLARVREALDAQFSRENVEVLEVVGYTWGEGLNRLAEVAQGDYWACLCDDTVPLPGWFHAGRTTLDSGCMPASSYVTVTGDPLRPGWDDAPHGTRLDWCRSFLLTPALYGEVGPFIDATWWADIDYSERLVKHGWPILACDGYRFTHLDGERDWNTPEENERQRLAYEESHRRQGIGVFT